MNDQDVDTSNVSALPAPPSPSPPHNSADIDKLTLELLVNKRKYKKYLAKTDPRKYVEIERNVEKYNKYKRDIQTLTHQLLEQNQYVHSSDVCISKEISDVFDTYIHLCVAHFEKLEQMVDAEAEPQYHDGDAEADDADIFTNLEPSPQHHKVKVPKSQKAVPSIPYYGMNMFMKR